MLRLVAAVVFFGGMYVAVRLGARRFADRERKLGRWDQYGPLEETEGPPYTGAAYAYNDMDERLEVIGKWHGRVLRRRAPGQKPDDNESA